MSTLIEHLSRSKTTLLAELAQDISDRRVLDAIAKVPRERFVPEEVRVHAYENRPLPIGYGQTISQPLIVALMTQALGLVGNEKVLEVGTGSGYQAALLSHLAGEVFSVERVAQLAQRAQRTLAELGFTNVRVRVADEALGWPEEAPYHGIIVTAGAPRVPQELLEQLATGGRMVIPVGSRDLQELVSVVESPEGPVLTNLGPCRFVPLMGAGAWSEDIPY
ncbi:MAG: protein-L-isoaspartate(D-aspartate) O-methyltransferase [Dehalococcoidia bacterium]|nr:MAG: protein-L-isoaspartate(D-aspartate) O-methyltransferase [Dehalococcoidia bacterium]